MPDSLSLIADILGALGAAILIVCYILLTFERLRVNLTYHLINLAAAIALFLSLLVNFNLGSFIIECFWIVTSSVGIVREIRKKRRAAPKA